MVNHTTNSYYSISRKIRHFFISIRVSPLDQSELFKVAMNVYNKLLAQVKVVMQEQRVPDL